MSLCAKHGHCNAINFNKNTDIENCVLIEAHKNVETDDGSDWLGYTTSLTCMQGCYRNGGMCLYQLPITKVTARHDAKLSNDWNINNRKITGKHPTNTGIEKANKLIWIRLDLGKIQRVVRLVLYISNHNINLINQVFSVKVGSHEQENKEQRILDVERATFCVYDVSKYPGKENADDSMIRKDVYCDGAIEGRFVYMSKYTITHTYYDQLSFHEIVVFGEKM